jgi:RHS repeat-associated protein
VTPSKAGYTFTPASQSVTISGANKTGINFTATQTAAAQSMAQAMEEASDGAGGPSRAGEGEVYFSQDAEAEAVAKAGMIEEILPGEAGFSAGSPVAGETFTLEVPDPGATEAEALQTAATPTPGALQNVTTFFYAWDHLGTIRLVSNPDRSVLERHDYEPFGVEMRPILNQTQNTHEFTGHERDQASEYDYMHARYYGGNMGRFMRPDPMDLRTQIASAMNNPQSWNLYAYVRGNPVNFNDPTGLAADQPEKKEGWWSKLWGSVKQGFEKLWDKTFGTSDSTSSDKSNQTKELEKEGVVNEGEAGQTDIGTKANAELKDAAATGATEVTKQVVILAATEGAGKVIEGAAGVAGKITGYTEHGLAQAMGREGVGVAPKAILDAVRDPLKVVPQEGRGTTMFVGRDATVILNKEGKVVTTWANGAAGVRSP